jgi:serine protease Do
LAENWWSSNYNYDNNDNNDRDEPLWVRSFDVIVIFIVISSPSLCYIVRNQHILFTSMLETDTPSSATNTDAPGASKRLLLFVVLVSLVAGFAGGYFGGNRTTGPAGASVTPEQRVVLQEESAVVDVVKKASPAVVSIVISKDLSRVPGYGMSPFDTDSFFPFFGFTQPRQQQPAEPNIQQVGAGSGFFVSADGLILTNKHVVSDTSASYTVLTNDGKSYDAQVVATDPANDIALVKIAIQNAPVLELADSEKLEVGQSAIAIGNSLGQYSNTVTTGVVSGIGRSVTAGGGSEGVEQLEGVIQTDAAINPGNSGGPLLNILGQVIGINTAIDREGQLVGFAIPANDARRAVDTYKKNGKITRPYLGVRYIMITEDLAKRQNLPRSYGALVSRGDQPTDLAVIPGSPADKAGVTENDIILEVNGQKLDEDHTLAGLLKKFTVGDTVTVKLYHKGEDKTVQVRLEESK